MTLYNIIKYITYIYIYIYIYIERSCIVFLQNASKNLLLNLSYAHENVFMSVSEGKRNVFQKILNTYETDGLSECLQYFIRVS